MRTRRRPRWSQVAMVAAGVAFLAIGVLWAVGRLARHEAPRWNERSFVALREAPGGPPAWDERWVVAVHPRCAHCRVSLASLAAARDRSLAEVRVAALIVDVASPPAESTVARLPSDETWWDASERWRNDWAHRVYGEIFCFDPAGRLLRMLPPLASEGDALAQLREAGFEALFP